MLTAQSVDCGDMFAQEEMDKGVIKHGVHVMRCTRLSVMCGETALLVHYFA